MSRDERTFIMVKPDGVARSLTGEVIKRFENKGYKLVAIKMLHAQRGVLEKHYAHLADLPNKNIFPEVVNHMTSGPVVAMVWEGRGVVEGGRQILGATRPWQAAPGTIRADFATDVGRNICHGSDTVENANKEIGLWFNSEIVEWNRGKVEDAIYE
uniref:Nucleoside diphosphate kinase 1 n=1 Tax=Anthurium amnicola TaxID=1678845 RepID=A0A1D1YCQ9_9ARAE